MLHFMYPSRAPPDLRSISFEKLKQVFLLTISWGMPLAEDYCRFHFQHHADKHSLAILGFVGDSATLLASLAPFIMDVTIDVMLSLGVSPMLCVRWAIFCERCLFAMIKAEEKLNEHDGCTAWRKAVKPYLQRQLHADGQLMILQLKKHVTDFDSESLTVHQVFESALEKINQFWKVNSSSRSMDSGESGDNNEEVDEDMVDELNDLDSSFGHEPEFIYCCKSHLQEWRNAVVVELSKVQF
ncbi:hypothetical protein BT96DRAFT_1005011 [Gymnopus androsaceus JB14]|uniref:Uncharacterized protein n=1 Tax=Gymnopus androsaceus JB14 TaxID=1447944 RepID=A0A6A4GPK8_9AGAR|nr:hypothetical protein BT96DRAFT_1005011 [Gymnopus androsaceus JB14]